MTSAGFRFRERVRRGLLPLVGVYDAFSARLAAERFEGVFCSGFGLSASLYGLPDIGFLTWTDLLEASLRVRRILPATHLLVDVDDGFGDAVIAANTVQGLELGGVSAVMLEDQRRPRRCGHFEGKELLPVPEYLVKLDRVLQAREELFVIARSDATTFEEGLARVIAYAEVGADGVMLEAVRDLRSIERIAREVSCPIMVNQIHGGRTPNWTLDELSSAGAGIVIYSTPCLFSAQRAIEGYLDALKSGGALPVIGSVALDDCRRVLEEAQGERVDAEEATPRQAVGGTRGRS